MTIGDLQQRLGYRFKDAALLTLALTHASAGTADYERLEFLGDRVLGLIVAECLYNLYPHEPEGDLSKRHTALVRGETLARAARSLKLGDDMILSAAERSSGGAENDNILSDVLEAVIGAVYLDGGLEKARDVLTPLIDGDLKSMAAPPRDSKTALQEWSQARNFGLPEYSLVERSGPDHAPEFIIRVSVHGLPAMEASGSSKRLAEKAAAQKMLDHLESAT
ncbi:MAG TPA: ribonuclease III [Alphaproteobacteria bacterium]